MQGRGFDVGVLREFRGEWAEHQWGKSWPCRCEDGHGANVEGNHALSAR